MRILMLKSTIVDLKQVAPGDIVETDEKSALLLIGIGKAEPAPEILSCPPKKPTTKRSKTNAAQSGDKNDSPEPAA